jgi:hypothetical protein
MGFWKLSQRGLNAKVITWTHCEMLLICTWAIILLKVDTVNGAYSERGCSVVGSISTEDRPLPSILLRS